MSTETHPTDRGGAQRVDDDVAEQLVDRGLDRDLVERARWVLPPVDVDTFEYELRFEGYSKERVRVREPEPNEMEFSEPGGVHRTTRDARLEQRDPDPAEIDREPVARYIYDPDLDWSEYASYRCRVVGCRQYCINRRDSIAHRHQYCWEHVPQHRLLPDLQALADE